MAQKEQPRWLRTARQALWIGGVIVAVTAVVFVINRFFVHRELWDWLKLLILPAVLAAGGLWFNRQQRERELETAREQREREVEIAERRAQDEALQAYLDQMGELLLDKDRPLRDSKEGTEIRTLARARTLTLLSRLDRARKRSAVQFLYKSGLVDTEQRIVDLTGANLSEANLFRADLGGADLSYANLRGANLRWAGDITNEELDQQAKSLEGATMPNGQKYEDWLKDREGSKEGGEDE
jgi:Pentapeptide repeats (8 copies)